MAAYDDPGGVTAAFNRNVLAVLNRELGADFDVGRSSITSPSGTPSEQWIEMRLRSRRRPGRARRATSTWRSSSTAGEDLLTEISAKFTPERVERELPAADFVVEAMWGADEGEFLLTLAHPYC